MEARLGEGAIWNHETQELFWVDIVGKRLHILEPATREHRSLPTPSMISTVVPVTDSLCIVALQDGAYFMDTNNGDLTHYVSLDTANTETRLNDGKCDPAGRFWVGSMHMPGKKADGKLYMIEEDGKVAVQMDSVTISNGIVWTKDQKTMYYIDTPTGEISAFDFDRRTGDIGNRRTAVNIPDTLGFPDGMAIDEEDKLWVGLWNGNAVARFDPENGSLMQKIKVPAHNVTACAFGGENLDSLFITSARIGMTPEELEKYPDAGSIFVAVPGVKGVKSDFFRLEGH
ncbi:MAG: SMP-30/gluconolactonase/LRE family protein [Bacteroidota bacterium]